MNSSANKLFLFDRDGIINARPLGTYVKSISEFTFHPDFFEVFSFINKIGFKTAVVTNQQGVGKELMTNSDLSAIHNFMQNEIYFRTGFRFDDIYSCTSLKEKNDYRRKPNPGMLNEAIEKYKTEKENIFIIGDSDSDIQAGKNAGVKTILINAFSNSNPDYHFRTLKEFLHYLNNHKYKF